MKQPEALSEIQSLKAYGFFQWSGARPCVRPCFFEGRPLRPGARVNPRPLRCRPLKTKKKAEIRPENGQHFQCWSVAKHSSGLQAGVEPDGRFVLARSDARVGIGGCAHFTRQQTVLYCAKPDFFAVPYKERPACKGCFQRIVSFSMIWFSFQRCLSPSRCFPTIFQSNRAPFPIICMVLYALGMVLYALGSG